MMPVGKHIHLLLAKAWKRIGLLRSFKFLLSRISLERMYYSFVRPVLEYADVVWDNLSDELNKEIESVQNEAARIVAGATKQCNIDKLISELGWESLENRRNKHKLILLYKMKNHISPSYLSNLLTPTQQSTYNLRHIDDLTPVPTRTH
jgi:hypothetical protein